MSAKSNGLSISVMVPSYKRPLDLERCLAALSKQKLQPLETLVVVRESDAETWAAMARARAAGHAERVRPVSVTGEGLVHAMNAGLADVRGDIVAITDDDAAPHPDWLERIVLTFERDPKIGGVGGRDYLYIGGVLQDGRARVVGKVPAIGKHVGNHHIGYGSARSVDLLKGVNGAYRTEALRPVGFDTRLRGTGAQVYWEIAVGIGLRRAGWTMIYDPGIAVDHFFSQRFDEDQRFRFNALAMKNATYNEALVRMEHLDARGRIAFLAWMLLIGTLASPGLLQMPRFFYREGANVAIRKLIATATGRLTAWNALRTGNFRQPVQ